MLHTHRAALPLPDCRPSTQATVAEGSQWKPFEFTQTTFETDMNGVSQQSFQVSGVGLKSTSKRKQTSALKGQAGCQPEIKI